jgi:2-(1,2-epoxy-1,2-dihydrophenyl)acetyl-CoA isomerase
MTAPLDRTIAPASLGGASPVLLSRDDGVATITVSNPRRKNAMTGAGWRGLRVALAEVAAGDARVLVITGAGEDRAFLEKRDPVFRGR